MRKSDPDAQIVANLARPDTYATERLGKKMHPKQAAILRDLFRPNSRVSARCANEIGKTTHIAAPAILYAIEILNAQAISTAGVWMQVAEQLIPALKSHAHLFPGWNFLETTISQGGINRYIGFSTRDEGFAQGFHRKEGMPLLAIVDEAAAVVDPVFKGIEDRCNPDYLLVMGSPLDPTGMFHKIETELSPFYSHHHISQLDCLKKDGYWIEQETIDRKIAKWGEKSQFVQSNIFGEFTDIVQGALLSLGEFDSCMANPPKWVNDGNRHGFLDFAAGRAKNVFAVRVGNRVWIAKKWTEKNTMAACGEFLATFHELQRQYGLQAEEVEGDADGLGKPMIDRLREMKFNLGAFHGGSAPRYDRGYHNAISEAWGEGAAHMKRKALIFPDDAEFKGQALSRKLKRNSQGLFQLESKEDMAKRGLDSPDEADAVFGAAMPAHIVKPIQVMGQADPFTLPGNKDTWPIEEPAGTAGGLPGAHFG